MKIPVLLPALLGCSLCACSWEDQPAEAPPPAPKALPEGVLLQLDLEGTAVGDPPVGWTVAETSSTSTPATWSVREAPGGGRALHVATTNSGRTYNLLLAEPDYPADLELSVRVRADTGEEDQGGGLIWRAQGADDYYIARWNPLESNLRVYKVEGGVRSLFQNAETPASAEHWHTLGVTMVSDRITVTLDGEPLLDTTDSTFSAGGRVGLWTKADAATWFDDLVVREPSWPEDR